MQEMPALAYLDIEACAGVRWGGWGARTRLAKSRTGRRWGVQRFYRVESVAMAREEMRWGVGRRLRVDLDLGAGGLPE